MNKSNRCRCPWDDDFQAHDSESDRWDVAGRNGPHLHPHLRRIFHSVTSRWTFGARVGANGPYHSWCEELIKPSTIHAMSQRIAPHARGAAMRMNSSASPGPPSKDPDAASRPLFRTDIRIQRAIPASEPKSMMRFANKRIWCVPSLVFISTPVLFRIISPPDSCTNPTMTMPRSALGIARLFVSQSDRRFDPRSTTCRNVTGENTRAKQYRRCRAEGCDICRLHSEQQTRDPPTCS